MKQFFLVFEDLLDPTQKRAVGPFEAESSESLAEQFQLRKIPNSPGIHPQYWDGKKAGDVIIYIVSGEDCKIQTPEDLQNFAFKLHCDWY